MFGNLVQIELIRLLKSRALKISAAIAVFMIIFVMTVADYIRYLGDAAFFNNIELTIPLFELVTYVGAYALASTIVASVTVIYTTSGYQKARLPVNIEGAIRNRLKLCLSELAGIALFDVLLSLLVLPGVGLMMLALRNDADPQALLSGLDLFYALGSMVLSQLYGCLVAYLISKFTSNPVLAGSVSVIYTVFTFLGLIFLTGIASVYSDDGPVVPEGIRDALFYTFLLLPIIALSTALAVRYKKADRI